MHPSRETGSVYSNLPSERGSYANGGENLNLM